VRLKKEVSTTAPHSPAHFRRSLRPGHKTKRSQVPSACPDSQPATLGGQKAPKEPREKDGSGVVVGENM